MNAYPSALARIDSVDLDTDAMTACIHISAMSVRGRTPTRPVTLRLETGNLYDWDLTPETAADRLPKAGEIRLIEYDPELSAQPYIVGWDEPPITPDANGNALARRAAWLKQAITDEGSSC